MPIGDHKIYGGSCISPVVDDADIYIGFDYGMAKSHKAYPWEAGESFLFPIQDMGVPKDPAQFKKLIEWISMQLAANKKIHVGCIGGHGRTGMVLSALVKHITGEVDAIQYVRKNYCTKAVESASQVKFLMTHFGVSTVKGHKEYDSYESKFHDTADRYGGSYGRGYGGGSSKSKSITSKAGPVLSSPKNTIAPVTIWGTTVICTPVLTNA